MAIRGLVDSSTGQEIPDADARYGGGGGMTWEVISDDTQAVKGHGYFIDASANSVILTLPASAAIGDQGIGIRVLSLTHSITVARNGHNIEGLAADLQVVNVDDNFVLTFANTGKGYVQTAG
jgi:hypothetical protein